jgi:hypothetical protein
MATDVISQIYNVGAVFASPSPATGYCFSSGNSGDNLLKQIPRVQSVGVNFSRNLQPVNQLGQFAAIDRVMIDAPTVNLSMSYYLLDGKAENVLGFNTSGDRSMIASILSRESSEKNYFLSIAPEGVDNIGHTNTSTTKTLAVANCYIDSYSLSAAVGSIPTANVSMQGINFASFVDSQNLDSPAIDYTQDQPVSNVKFSIPTAISYTGANTVSVLRPGEIELQIPNAAGFGDYVSGVGAIHINSCSLSFNLSPENVPSLGHFYGNGKKTNRPVDVQFSVDGLAADIAVSSLSTLRCNDPLSNMKLVFRGGCSSTGTPQIAIDLKGFKFDSRDYSLGIGGPATVRYNFSAQMSAGTSIDKGVLFSGNHMNVVAG